MTDKTLRSRIRRFFLDHLLLWMLLAMVLTVLGIIFIAPRGNIYNHIDSSFHWPDAESR
ncbi:hypothetical protein J2857_005235 [Neorhizobium galegae]|uniref:hypothetical protein n=1 Tax=Neorhizobium galegae TaxID=399 RepID=UPI001AE8D219|nr:hypothetical protein [Neorhizobium galegae]MBP2562444.1 hypothetical protein [Neorhizobium galegae]